MPEEPIGFQPGPTINLPAPPPGANTPLLEAVNDAGQRSIESSEAAETAEIANQVSTTAQAAEYTVSGSGAGSGLTLAELGTVVAEAVAAVAEVAAVLSIPGDSGPGAVIIDGPADGTWAGPDPNN